MLVTTLERKRSEESLSKAEEKYRRIYEGAMEGIYESSREGKYLTANPALAKMLGYDSADEVSSSTSDLATQIWVIWTSGRRMCGCLKSRMSSVALRPSSGVRTGRKSGFRSTAGECADRMDKRSFIQVS